MSTIAEHLAALECYQEMRWSRDPDIRKFNSFTAEASLFCEVHLKELVAALCKTEDMVAARAVHEQRLRDQVPAVAEKLIEAWHSATPWARG